ncbi:MAG: ATP-binding protein [Rhodanobacter sp.]
MRAPSLRDRLRWIILAVLLAVLLPLGMYSFQRTLTEVDELLDGRLAQSAHTLDVLIQHAGIESLRGSMVDTLVVPTKAEMHGAPNRTYESEVGFQVFDSTRHMRLMTSNLAQLPLPNKLKPGFQDLEYGGYGWRVFTMIDGTGGALIRVGERHDSRRDITHAMWLDNGLPLLLGLPILAVLVGWAVRRGLRPLERLTRELATRAPGSRKPIVLEAAPQELQPVLGALNGQLERLEDALERERRFSADVAHELRTPLASTMIHLEGAMQANLPADAAAALVSAQNGLVGLARRIQQLLALARLESGAASGQRVPVDLAAVAMDVFDELTPLMADSNVELGFIHDGRPVVVAGYEAALAALLRNLIENALHHVPGGGQVQLSLTQDAHGTVIDVIDDGPGIPEERRKSVFARFHREVSSRGDGYGLGLSIVQRAAELHHASIELLDSPLGRGLRVRVVIPPAPGSTSSTDDHSINSAAAA